MILGIVEHEDGVPDDVSLEMLELARDVASQQGDPLEAVVFGEGDSVAGDLGTYGVSTVHAIEAEELQPYSPQAWAEGVNQLVEDLAPEAVVAPGSDRGYEVMAHVGAQRDIHVAANCLEVTPGDTYEIARQRWGGTLIEHARVSHDPKLLTVAPNELSPTTAEESADAAVETFQPSIEDSPTHVAIDRVEESDEEGIPLGEARVVVSGGRGVGSAEDFDKLEELADLLDAAIGSSRAAVNEGWRSHDDQIGQTGAKISPKLYIPCGISGAVQHMVGAKGSENIMAINTDPEAAIIGKAEYAVIGDLHEVVPELNEAIRERSD